MFIVTFISVWDYIKVQRKRMSVLRMKLFSYKKQSGFREGVEWYRGITKSKQKLWKALEVKVMILQVLQLQVIVYRRWINSTA